MMEVCLIGMVTGLAAVAVGCLIVITVRINRIAALVDMIEYKQRDENEI